MSSSLRLVTTLALGFVLEITAANAQQLLSGFTTGSFELLSAKNSSVTNAADGRSATFQTGVSVAGSTPSAIQFTSTTFAGLSSLDHVPIGSFSFTNGMIALGSGAPSVKFNLGILMGSNSETPLQLGSIIFHIDHTPNNRGLVPDVFSATFVPTGPLLLKDFTGQFRADVHSLRVDVDENATLVNGDLYLSFVPVPEPSTVALWISAAVLTCVLGRRLFGRFAVRSGTATAVG